MLQLSPKKYCLVVFKSPAYQILHCIVTLGFIFASYVLLYLLLFLSLAVLCCLDQREPSSFLPLLLLSSSLDYSPVDSWFILLLSIYVRVLHFDELLHQFLQKVFFLVSLELDIYSCLSMRNWCLSCKCAVAGVMPPKLYSF